MASSVRSCYSTQVRRCTSEARLSRSRQGLRRPARRSIPAQPASSWPLCREDKGACTSVSLRLDDIVQATRDSLARRKKERPISQLEHELAQRGEGRPFQEALSHPGTSLVAEHKRRSPSAGVI